MKQHDRSPPFCNARKAGTSIEIDLSEYLPYLDDCEIAEADKLKLIEALFSIMRSLVDYGFEIHPVQSACGQFSQAEKKRTCDSGNSVELKTEALGPVFTDEADARVLEVADAER